VRPSFDGSAHAGATGANNYYIVLVVVSFSSVFV
jgi:hypothetical protein